MANTAAKKAAPAKKKTTAQVVDYKTMYTELLNQHRELQDLTVKLNETIKYQSSAIAEERATAQNYRDQYHALRDGYTEGISDAYGIIKNILSGLQPFEVPAVLGNLVTDLKKTNQAIRNNIHREIMEREKEKDDYINVDDALGMALQGRTDFLNLFTATQSIRHGQKNTYSQSTGENSKTFKTVL